MDAQRLRSGILVIVTLVLIALVASAYPVLWFVVPFGLLTGWVALQKGRWFAPWFLLGCVLPIVSLLALIAVPSRRPAADL